jgi:hypothetical protein
LEPHRNRGYGQRHSDGGFATRRERPVEIACIAGVKAIALTHHDPIRDDDDIDKIVEANHDDPNPDFSYRVGFRGGDDVRDGSANEGKDGCGLNRLAATFASPFGGYGPQGGLPGLFWPRFLVRQAVAAAASAA